MNIFNFLNIKQVFAFLFIVLACVIAPIATYSQVTNFTKEGKQITKFSKLGDAIDAHDGEIAYFNGVYYLYGTSYGCGFEWGHKDAPFCGFKVYTSNDLITWKDRGELFDASTAIWQTRCNGNTYGCFRPHVIYNINTHQYVLWINVYDNSVGYRVFTGKSPMGPFIEAAEPKLAVNSDAPVAGLNNGDHDTFVDDDGTAYLAYTDWREKGAIAIEQLSANYLTGTGKVTRAITASRTEAPSLFKRNGIYYLLYSDPNCGYCSGTGASYRTAPSTMGPWSEGIRISDNSCGGQPSFVSFIKLKSGEVFLFGSDLWNNAAKNEALANYFWAPLTFAANGAINKIECGTTFSVSSPENKQLRKNAAVENLTPVGDIDSTHERSQTFIAEQNGFLRELTISFFKNRYPDKGLSIKISDAGGDLLGTVNVAADSVSWSPKNIVVHPNVRLKKGRHYSITVSTEATKGIFGMLYYSETDTNPTKRFLFSKRIAPK